MSPSPLFRDRGIVAHKTPPVTPPGGGTLILNDSFEIAYGVNNGFNPNMAPPVFDPPTVPPNTDPINDQRSWGPSDPAYYSIVNVPVPGAGAKCVRIFRPANLGNVWVSRWTYRVPGPRYYGWMIYLPANWVSPHNKAANGGIGEWSVSMEMNYHPFVYGGGVANLHIYEDWLKLGVVTGYCEGNGVSSRGGVQFADYKNGGSWENLPSTDAIIENWPDSQFELIPRGQMNKGVWHQVILGVNWTVGPAHGGDDGWYRGWWKRLGEPAWNQTINFGASGHYPTFNWGLDVNGVMWTVPQMLGAATWFNYGLYSPPQAWSNTYYLDNISEGTSFTAIANTMP